MRFIRCEADQATLVLYGPIGEHYQGGVTAKTVLEELQGLSASVRTIVVHVNSIGGCPFEGHAIATALHHERRANGRTVDVRIDGIAASAATIITCAGDPIRIAETALVMVHMPYALTIGTAAEHRENAVALDKIADAIIVAYRWTSTKAEAELRAMMAATTWLDAREAVAAGFATEVFTKAHASEPAASASAFPRELVARLGTIPARYRQHFDRLARSGRHTLTPANRTLAEQVYGSRCGPPSGPYDFRGDAA